MNADQLARNLTEDGAATEAVSRITEAVSVLSRAHDAMLRVGECEARGVILDAMVALCNAQATINSEAYPVTD
jgi:cellobiose-specific phosphotransferase system component IIA